MKHQNTNRGDRRSARPALALFLTGTILTTGMTRADVGRGGLDETREFSDSGVDYTITYSDTAGDSDRVSTADVDNLEDFAKTSYDRLVDVMGFPVPWLSTLQDYEFIVKDDWWFAEPACVVLDAPSIRAWPADDSRVVFFHERFHTVQRNYKDSVNGGGSGYIGSTFGKWVSEGTADAMMDKGYADIDDKVGYPYYEGSAVNFLNSPDETLFDKEYDCCLWWNYSMEQLGTNKVEPHYGTEFMKAFWNKIVANGQTGTANSKLTFEQVVAARGRSLESVFHDFTICNYTREFDVAGIPNASRYFYVDEQTLAISTNVPKTATGITSSGSTAVNSWAAKYIEATVDGTDECFAVGFKAESDGDTMAFSVVATDRTGKVIGIKKGIGTEFAGVFFSEPGRPVEKVCGIIGGLEEGGTVDWDFDAGVPQVTIERPTFTRPAYPGTFDAPGNIVVTTKVTGLSNLAPDGPNTPSILGLEKDYFGVTVGAESATVLDAAYVGGLWELLVAAPVQPSDGLYDLTVTLCPGTAGGVSDTEKNAVLYGDLVFHHAVVLDVSGSMNYPSSAKLDAAKQAAKFYIDSVHENDRFTVVSFSGDGSECNEDATNLKGAAGLLAGTSASRILMKGVVDALPSQNLTSIGDGLWTAQDALDNDAAPDAIDTILLLTDGKENESRYWASDPDGCGRVDTRILAAETIVNTRAFGENAETDLCQQIATATTGDYLFNPVDEASAKSRAATSDFASLRNQLTLRFFAGLEHSKKLQRIALEKSDLRANDRAEIVLPQPYDKVTAPLIYVGWSAPTGVTVEIETPNGQDLAGISTVYTEGTHVVFHPKDPLIRGDYIVRIEETGGNDVEVFAGISGKPDNALDFVCSLSPVRVGGLVGRPEHPRELFEHGMPVDINLAAFDLKGPIRGLDVSVEVTMPDGRLSCPIPLIMADDGANQDGSANDGRYGHRYTRTPMGANYALGNADRDEKAEAPVGSSGTYRVVIRARGRDNLGNPMDRSFEKAFQVYVRGEFGNGKGDSDGDGMPDSWEVFYGTKPLVPDADVDKDQDGLRNIDEFNFGTHPCDPDSDNGGAADGYEVQHGLCPRNPQDDPFPNLAPVAVITSSDSDAHGDVRNLLPDALLLHFPDHPSYGEMEVYRDTFTGFSCDASTLVKTLPMDGLVTSFYDKGLADGQRYFYKFRALSVDGSAGTPISREVSGVARHDPAEPFGSVVLNSAQDRSDRKKLAVKLLPRGTATHYRLAEGPFTGAEPWFALPGFGDIVPFELTAPGLGDGDRAYVYFQFGTPGGLESRIYHVDIRLDFSSDTDGDGKPDGTDTDDDGDGIDDDDELYVHCTNPYSRDTDGDGYQDDEEIAQGSDPTDFDSVPDTDGDGFNDRLEDLLGSDPNDPFNVPDIGLQVVTSGGQSEVSFDTAVGVIYRLHSRSELSSRVRDWPVVAGPFDGTGARRTVLAPLVPDPTFYGVSFELAPAP
jgi:hypothetical protein